MARRWRPASAHGPARGPDPPVERMARTTPPRPVRIGRRGSVRSRSAVNPLVPLIFFLYTIWLWYCNSKFLSFDAVQPPNQKETLPSRNRKDVPLSSATNNVRRRQECVSAALVLYGVPKSFPYIYRGYTKNIVKRNPHVCFEVHMHMYNDLHLTPFSNVRAGERNVTLESPENVRKVLNAGGDGLPARLVTSSQANFDASELSWMDENITRNFDGLTVTSLRNMFRQGNSMKEAYVSASFSYDLRPGRHQRHGHDVYIFARSDTLLVSPVDVPPDGVGDGEMRVLGYHRCGGDNDWFALAGPVAAGVWTATKLNVFREMILHPNETIQAMERENRTGWDDLYANGKIRYTSWDGRLRNPEKMLRMWLDANDGVVDVRRMGSNWARILRVRSGGLLMPMDLRQFKMKEKSVHDVVL